MGKKRKNNLKRNIFIVFGLSIFLGAIFMYILRLDFKYPPLNRCFKASVSKALLCGKSKDYVKLNKVSPYFLEILILSEDDKFYSHSGFDWKELQNSVMKNLRNFSFMRGGSTITQQLVKNVYLSQEKTLGRKIKEAAIAYNLEKKYKKSIILEKYVNAIEFGVNLWGIKKASWHYFQTDPEFLGVLESAYLVMLLPSPKRYSRSFKEGVLTPYQKKRIIFLIDRLKRKKVIEEDYAEELKLEIDDFPWTFLF